MKSSYYGELCTKMYESDKSMAEGAELDFFLAFAGKEGLRVLEPMCGNGRMLLPLLQRGIDIEGFDLSEDMLAACREKALRMGLRPKLSRQSLEEFRSGSKYGLILIPFGSFSLLPEDLVDASLRRLNDVLEVDGKLLLTIVLKQGEPEASSDESILKNEFEDETIMQRKRTEYDPERSVLHTRLLYELRRDGITLQREQMDYSLRLYAKDEFQQRLYANGFGQVTVHEVKDGYGPGADCHVFECLKSG
ncbi:class I SAM-dependent methyltransferase [Paenibacillus albicereus]|uniref:class I SAM-dependent methyltransferase n=1 Tax=Paenibacillus albicereus TaxID=2726185 RepID=UPI002E2A005E|nr:class I SAM-dependent methyltransferase [Paenibacillus albicereus]